jgi:hypothetical protein
MLGGLMFKRLSIIILILSIASPAVAATLYVDADCSNGISTYNEATQQCTGGTSTVYSSITNAQIVQSATDTISLGDGTYNIGSLTLAAQVSLTSTSQDKSLVTLTPSSSNTSTPFINLSSVTPGTTGNQSISYVTIDGRNASYYFYKGIYVKNRDGVEIHHCTIEDFNADGSYSYSFENIYGVKVESDSITVNNMWYNYFASVSSLNKSTAYTNATPVDNFSLHDNTIDDCGDGNTSREYSYAVILKLLSNSIIYNNDIDVSHSYTEAIGSTSALWDSVDVYNNTLTGHAGGYFPVGDGSSKSLYLIETWVMHDSDVYNNILVNGGISYAYGQGCNIYNNYIDRRSATSPRGYCIEFTAHNNGSVYRNNCLGRADAATGGDGNGIMVGLPSSIDKDYDITSYVYNNIIHNQRNHGLSLVGGSSTYNPTVNLYVYNNMIDANGKNVGYYGIGMWQSGSVTMNTYIKNNIITNNGVGILESGTVGGEIDNNSIYGNTTNLSGCSASNTISTEPTYTDYASDDFTMSTGDGVDAGDDLGIPYQTAINDGTNWSSDPLVVSTVDRDTYAPWDLGPYEYDAGGSDVTGPTISNKDPYDGEQLTYGTTSVNGDVDATDASGVEGCECNEGSFSYGDGTTMTNPAGDTYRCGLLTGLTNDTLYDDTWHYICQDSSTNSNETSGTWSFSVAPTGGGDVIVDNLDAGFSQSTSGWAGNTVRDDAYGDSHDYDTSYGAQGSGVWARWTPTISTSGTYEVYMWTFSGGHPDAAPFTIVHSSGTAIGTVNQVGSGSWVSMGTYCFNAGTDGYVQVTDEDDGYLIADAVRFEFQQSGCGGGTPSGSGFVTGGGTGYIKGN